MTQSNRHFIWLGLSLCASIVVSALIIQGVEIYKREQARRFATDATRIAILNRDYPTYIMIQTYDPTSRAITALVRSNPASSDIPMRITLLDNGTIERQNAIMENGVYAGAQEKVAASPTDLMPGTRALAHIMLNPDGLFTDYLLIGNPFPRP